MNDDGAATVEVVLLAPVLVALVWLLIWAGTASQVPGGLQVAVEDAARLASTVRVVGEREPRAAALVADRMAGTCAPLDVAVAVDGLLLTVTATCGLVSPQSDALGVPARTATAVGRSSVDPFVEVVP